MTLRQKTLLTIGLTLVGLIVVLYFIAVVLTQDRLTSLEQQITRQNIERVVNAMQDDLASLDVTTEDYAAWDDTYNFIQNPIDVTYTEDNYFDGTFTDLELNLVLLVNTSNQLVFGKAFDLENEAAIPLPDSIQILLNDNSPLMGHPDIMSRTAGILLLPEGPLLVSSRPILTSINEGPIRGSLIMGRYLNDSKLERLAQLTNLSLRLERLDTLVLPEDFEEAHQNLSAPNPFYIQPLDSHTIAGYALFQDIYDRPAFILRVAIPRNIYAQGQTSLRYFLALLVVAGLIFGGVTLWLLEKLVLSRLTHLGSEVKVIGLHGDASTRVTVNGRDELASLSHNINQMLTALEQSQQELQQAKKEAERANQAKSTFLASMSHELRTPLGAIIGYSEMLLEEVGDLSQEQLETDLNKIKISGKHLLNIINDVLDLSKIEAGKIELYPETFSVSELIEYIVTNVQPLVDQNGNTLKVNCAQELGVMRTDLSKLRQSLINLLSNAAKFTQNGEIFLSVTRANNEDWVIFDVSDSGIGIPPEALPKLFQPFVQADSSTTRKYGGTGLGLVISRHFCRMMGGDITAISQGIPGQGSTFTIRLPATIGDEQVGGEAT
jgi:signal transduction histidine kinase